MRKMLVSACAALLTCGVMAGAAVASGANTSAKSATVSGLDKESLKTSMQGDLFEIAGGQLALHKTHNRAVANLGRRLITDHTKAYDDGAKLARRLGIEVERTPAPTQVWQLRTLADVRGRTFDRWYTSLEIYDHKQDIDETTDEIKDGSNSDVIANAKQDLPMLKMHLRLSEAAYGTVR